MPASVILVHVRENLVRGKEGGELLGLVVVESDAVADEGCPLTWILVEQFLSVL